MGIVKFSSKFWGIIGATFCQPEKPSAELGEAIDSLAKVSSSVAISAIAYSIVEAASFSVQTVDLTLVIFGLMALLTTAMVPLLGWDELEFCFSLAISWTLANFAWRDGNEASLNLVCAESSFDGWIAWGLWILVCAIAVWKLSQLDQAKYLDYL